jgi:hypothetical protein
MADGQDQQAAPIYQMVQDPDFGKMAASEQRKALSGHDPGFAKMGDADITRFVKSHQGSPASQASPAATQPSAAQALYAANQAQQSDFAKQSPGMAYQGPRLMPPSQQQTNQTQASTQAQDQKPSFGSEAKKNIGNLMHFLGYGAQGLVDPQAAIQRSFMDAQQEAATGNPRPGAAELLKRPLRELAGVPQPGESVMMPSFMTDTGQSQREPLATRTAMAMDTLIGGNPQAARANFASGNKGAGVADLLTGGPELALAGQLANAKINRTPVQKSVTPMPKQIESLASLVDSRAGKIDPHEIAQSALEPLRNEAAKQGITTSQFKGRSGGQLALKIADDAIESHENEVATISKPFLSRTISTQPIADAIRSGVTPELLKNAPEVASRIEGEAAKFDGADTLQNVNDFRVRMNKELTAFYKKGTSQQIATDVETTSQEAGVKAARQLQYDAVGNMAGVDPQYIRQIMNREGSLIDAKTSLEKEYNTTSKAQAQAVSQSLREKTLGVQGKASLQDIKSSIIKGTLGMKPIDVLNARLKSMFGDLGPHQPPVQPAAPGGIPPIGPNRPMLGAGQYPMPPSGIAQTSPQVQQAIIQDLQNAMEKAVRSSKKK